MTETVEESGPVSLVSRTLTDGSVAYDVHLLCAEGSGQAPQGRPDLRLVFPCETEIAALDLFDALRDAPRAEVHRIDGETGQGGAQ